MTLPPSVDLRSAIDHTYDQAHTNACVAHAAVNALDAMHDNAGLRHRFSRAWLWYWGRKFSGREREDFGLVFDSIKWALETKGAVLERDCPWTASPLWQEPAPLPSAVGAMTVALLNYAAGDVDAIKRKLAMGVPVVLSLYVYPGLYALHDKRDWRTHKIDPYGFSEGKHAVCIVGYDDACQRFLVENSWGPGWADGGFFGLPYGEFRLACERTWCIDRIRNFAPAPAPGMDMKAKMDAGDYAAFARQNRERLQMQLAQALERGGVQEVIVMAKREGVSDKHLEALFAWDRGAVRAVHDASPGLDWTGFIWADL